MSLILFTFIKPHPDLSFYSLVLHLQQCSEMYKNIRTSRRLRKSSKNIPFVCLILILFHVVVLVSWLFILILLSGDIELNPDPYSVDGSADTSDILSSTSFDSLNNHLSILHLNIQSILSKIDLIRGEATSYDILIFSESWLKPTVNNHEIRIENFMPPFRTDRNDRPGGGVIVYVRDTLSCKRRVDLEVHGVEGVWLELTIKSKRILVGGFYRPPNSSLEYFNLLKESIDRACSTNIIDIIITGDFNYNMKSENNKISEITREFNLTQLISEPTHFTEDSSSILDLILVRNKTNIIFSGVIDPFTPEQVRYHCPTIVLLKFLRPPNCSIQKASLVL